MRSFAFERQWRRHFNAGLVLFLLVSTAWTVRARADDTPAHRAARLSYLQGNVTVDHMDNTAGDPAQINMPLAEGARLTTGEDGQAEVEFEDGSIVRITPDSSVGLNSLSVDSFGNLHTQLAVLGGLVYAELRATTKFTYTVEAGGEQISPVANATIRINMDQPPVTISVFDGTVHLEHGSPEAGGYKTDVHAGEMLTADGSDSSQYFLLSSIEKDSWDVWNQERDQAAATLAAARTAARNAYAGDQGYGWSDLDANGSWYDVPGVGQLWQPTVALDASFDPYGYGSWVSYPDAGYVWASGYSWGWVPFRCGTWSYWNSFGWGWSPTRGCRRVGWGFGYGFGSGVYVVNIGRPPANYHLPTRPVHTPGMLHPILVGHASTESVTDVGPSRELRVIAGVPVEPLRPVANPTAQTDRSVVGSALRSDFAVDRVTQQPVLGVAGAALPTTSRSDLRSSTLLGSSTPSDAADENQRRINSLGPIPLPPERSNYPALTQGEHSAPRPAAPAYAPRSAPPPSAPRPAPSAPAPAAPKR